MFRSPIAGDKATGRMSRGLGAITIVPTPIVVHRADYIEEVGRHGAATS